MIRPFLATARQRYSPDPSRNTCMQFFGFFIAAPLSTERIVN
jgi:hypothetical protein